LTATEDTRNVPLATRSRVTSQNQAVAREALLQMTPREWRLVCDFEALLRILKPLMPLIPPPEDPSKPPGSILVVEYWNFGDLAVLVPFLRNLRQRFPKAIISLLVRPELAHFLDGQGIVDEFIPVRVPW